MSCFNFYIASSQILRFWPLVFAASKVTEKTRPYEFSSGGFVKRVLDTANGSYRAKMLACILALMC